MSLKQKSIFIVEDNFLNRLTYQIALVREGAFVTFESWGPNAVKMLIAGRKYDLIILDLMLAQGTTGYKIFEEIRNLPLYQQTPIIAISAAEPSEAMARCRELGFDGYIAKPIDEEQFPRQLERAIEGESIWIFR